MSITTKRNFNASIFQNKSDKNVFNKSKTEKVKADYHGNGSDKDGMDKVEINGIKELSKNSGKKQISLVFIDRTVEGTTSFYNGKLFPNDRKEQDGQPDFTGVLNLDKETNGPKLRLAGWLKKTKKDDAYLSISVSEYKNKEEAAEDQAAAEAPALETAGAPADSDFPF
ncbi:hypothetical protein [Noviherbaspirillum galbum]|uniref:DUF736 domain-containing protein n=1 Tax=Noviherbaspirillum galbum TaxID=2709383 RepID=A0A6B3SVF9_9BURK|nr:hypothetical protein [Noviherbaspirillum galbum]NEX63375.1 hypothetical protein [Noviherbaspirillum galbum]